nr:hypothetical protein [Streptomyces sp. NWU49]
MVLMVSFVLVVAAACAMFGREAAAALADGAGDLTPDSKADGHLGSVAGGGHQVAAGSEGGNCR